MNLLRPTTKRNNNNNNGTTSNSSETTDSNDGTSSRMRGTGVVFSTLRKLTTIGLTRLSLSLAFLNTSKTSVVTILVLLSAVGVSVHILLNPSYGYFTTTTTTTTTTSVLRHNDIRLDSRFRLPTTISGTNADGVDDQTFFPIFQQILQHTNNLTRASSERNSLSDTQNDRNNNLLECPAISTTGVDKKVHDKSIDLVTLQIPREHPLERFLEGPALALFQEENDKQQMQKQTGKHSTKRAKSEDLSSTMTTQPTTAAACKFVIDEKHSSHYPHAMQQLYACFSWWYSNPHKDWYLISLPPNHKNSHNKFLYGFIDALRDVFNVSTVRHRNGLPVVRPIVEYKYIHEIEDVYADHEPKSMQTKKTSSNKKKSTNNNMIVIDPTKHHVGFQMSNRNAVTYLRDSILSYYHNRIVSLIQRQPDRFHSNNENVLNFRPTSTATTEKQKQQTESSSCPTTIQRIPRITILNRHSQSGRRVYPIGLLYDAVNEYVQHLYHERKQSSSSSTTNTDDEALLPKVIVVDHFDDSTFLEQITTYLTSDIIISPHGAQLTGIPFMMTTTTTAGTDQDIGANNKKCKTSSTNTNNAIGIIELFPVGYFCPEFYASLAAVSGLLYDCIYTGVDFQQETNQYMYDVTTRDMARAFDICIANPSTDDNGDGTSNVNDRNHHHQQLQQEQHDAASLILVQKILYSLHKMLHSQWLMPNTDDDDSVHASSKEKQKQEELPMIQIVQERIMPIPPQE